MKIDIASHIVAPKLRQAIAQRAPASGMLYATLPALIDLDARAQVMKPYPDVLELLSVANAMEEAGPPELVYDLARVANDEMAELAEQYPERFAGAIAIIPLTDIDRAMREVNHAIDELGCRGIMINNSGTQPLDRPDLMAIYEKMVQHDLPICIHPVGGASSPDYPGEEGSLFEIWSLWGWPYQTTLTMTRLIFSGVFDRLPDIKFITHHAGGMVPFMEHRIKHFYGRAVERGDAHVVRLKKDPMDYYRMFYSDTANSATASGLMCARDFFGIDRLLYGTDIPWGMPVGYGGGLCEDTISYVEAMDISAEEREKIYVGNARRLFHLP